MKQGGQSGSVLFVPPKLYHFDDPELEVAVNEAGGTVTVTAKAFVKGVEIYGDDELALEDNFFDMEPGSRTLKIVHRGSAVKESEKHLRVRSVFDIC